MAFPRSRQPHPCVGEGGDHALRSCVVGPRSSFTRLIARSPQSKAHLVLPGPCCHGTRAQESSCSPLRRTHRGRVLPRTEARIGSTLPHAEHVPSSWFLTTPTVFASHSIESLLHLSANLEVHRVAGAGRPMPATLPLRSLGVRPSRAFPSTCSRAHVTVIACPLAFGVVQTPDFEALIRRGVRCAAAPLPERPTRGSPGFPCSGAVRRVMRQAPTVVNPALNRAERGRALRGEPRGVEPSGLPARSRCCHPVHASSKRPSAPLTPKGARPRRYNLCGGLATVPRPSRHPASVERTPVSRDDRSMCSKPTPFARPAVGSHHSPRAVT